MITIDVNRRRRWPWLVVGIFLGLLVVLYFVVTSGAFLQRIVLPRIGAVLNSELTVEEISLTPFSSLTLRKVRLTPRGAEPLAVIQEVRLRYSLWSILRGNIRVSEVTVESPLITIYDRPDGSSNLSALINSLPQEPDSANVAEPVQLEVRNVALKNGVFRKISTAPTGTNEIQVSNLHISLDQLINGAASKLTISSVAGTTVGITNQLAAAADGAFGFELNPRLLPTRFNGALEVKVTKAEGRFREFGQMALKLSADATEQAIREWKLALTESGRSVGELLVQGPFNLENQEMQLDYELKGIDRNALGMLGAMFGVDLGQTRLKAKGKLEVSEAGQSITSQGTISVDQLTVKTAQGTSPILDSTLEYQFQVDLAKKAARLTKAALLVRQKGTPIITGGLDQPMNLAWDSAVPGFQAATYSLSVKRFDLAPWRLMLSTNLIAGQLDLEASVTTGRDGRRLNIAFGGSLDQASFQIADKTIRDLSINLNVGGSVEDFQLYTLDQADGQALISGQTLSRYSALGFLDQRRNDLGGQLSLDIEIPTVLRTIPVDGLELSSGLVTLKSQVATKSGQTNVTLNAKISGLNGKAFGLTLRDDQATVEAVATLAGTRIVFNQGKLSTQSGSTPTGSLDLTGEYDRASEHASLSLNLYLAATAKASNRLKAAGQFYFATNSTTPSSLDLTSDGLDLTSLYDRFASTSASAKPAPTASSESVEPLRLTVRDFSLDSKIAKLFLREIAVSNWITKASIKGGKVVVKPVTLTLNGAPITASADIDLDVPGYQYDLNANLESVPVRPLARSLLKGNLVDLKGTLDARLALAGQGTEGVDLKKHLNGNISFAATNLDYEVTALRTPLMQGLVQTLASVLHVPNITQSPIQGIAANMEAGRGTLNLKSARVNSAAFAAGAQGRLRFADILTNSPIEIPITVSLPREGRFEALPQFLTFRGTLGSPKADLNPLGMAQLATQLPGSAGNIINQGINQLGGALDRALGQKGSTNPGVGTGLIQGLLGGPRTNLPAGGPSTNTNAPARSANPLDHFKKSN